MKQLITENKLITLNDKTLLKASIKRNNLSNDKYNSLIYKLIGKLIVFNGDIFRVVKLHLYQRSVNKITDIFLMELEEIKRGE